MFKNGVFNGHGEEKGEYHEFKGEYYAGNRTKGVLKWKDYDGREFTFKGSFNFNN